MSDSTMSNPECTQKPSQVYFFGTCLIDLFYPDAGLSAIELIEREGVRVFFPQQQTCCGQPPYNSGYKQEAIDVALNQIDCFKAPIPIVVPSGSCAGMMKHHYPALFKNHPQQERAEEFASRIVEFTEFLVNTLDISLEDKGTPIKVALHSSCSARREMNTEKEGRSLLEQLRNVVVCEPDRANECCGFGGTFSIKQPEISAAMTKDKCNALHQTGASAFVSGDCGCMMNLSGFMDKNNQPMQNEHLASFLLKRTR